MTVQSLKEILVSAARRAEIGILTCYGYQHLQDLGWEWKVLARICQYYKLNCVAKWNPEGSPGGGSVSPGGVFSHENTPHIVPSAAYPASTAASAAAEPGAASPSLPKSGFALAKDFMLDGCVALAVRECRVNVDAHDGW